MQIIYCMYFLKMVEKFIWMAINLINKYFLLEILIIANGLGLILNENCLIESIKISNLGIINWILNKSNTTNWLAKWNGAN